MAVIDAIAARAPAMMMIMMMIMMTTPEFRVGAERAVRIECVEVGARSQEALQRLAAGQAHTQVRGLRTAPVEMPIMARRGMLRVVARRWL